MMFAPLCIPGRLMFNLRSMDLNLLTVFEAIYEKASVRGAAGKLGLSQSATSHALARLRETLDDELFKKAGSGLAPTPVARALFPAVQRSLASLRLGLADARGFHPAISRREFRISNPHPAGPFHALQLIRRAAELAPGVVLKFDTRTNPHNRDEALRDGELDLAIDWMPAQRQQFVVKKLFDERLMIIVRRDHPRIGASATLQELQRERFVGLEPRLPVLLQPEAARQLDALGLRAAVVVSEFLEVPTVVTSTDLLGVMPASTDGPLAARNGLRFLPLPQRLPLVPIYLIWHVAQRRDAGHQWLRELVTAEVRVDTRPAVTARPRAAAE